MRRNQALNLARTTRTVSATTRARGSITLMGLIEEYLAKRASHVAAVAVIDGELGRVYERLGHDIPARVQEVATMATATASTLAPATPPTSRPELAGLTISEAVLAVIGAGSALSREVYLALGQFKRERVKHALSALVDQAVLTRSGKTAQTRYARTSLPSPTRQASPPARKAAAPVAPITRRDDDIEYETVWSPGREAPSLLGPRASRASL